MQLAFEITIFILKHELNITFLNAMFYYQLQMKLYLNFTKNFIMAYLLCSTL